MTRTYNDADALTRLLEEKERDVELAAHIGQQLLEQNRDLNKKVEHLEQELLLASDTVTQLKHDLTLKNGLLQIYCQQDSETDSEANTPSGDKSFAVNIESLYKKISLLEEENTSLRGEAMTKLSDLEKEEKKEMQLIQDHFKLVSEVNSENSALRDELSKKTDETYRQQEEITNLLSQVAELQKSFRKLQYENDELERSLQVSKECQNELTLELIEVKDKYQELHTAFQELQKESKKNKKNRMPSPANWPYGLYTRYINPDSLASELQMSLSRDSDGYASDDRLTHNKRVFNTVRYAKGSSRIHTSSSSRQNSSRFSSAMCLNDGSNSDSESLYAESYQTDDDSQYSSLSSIGKPCVPTDIEVSPRKLNSRGISTEYLDEEPASRCQTPDSVLSTGSGRGYMGTLIKHYHMPEKLQIIKPIEGSQTLQHWRELATPNLGGIFESRPGVQVRGERKVPELESSTVALSDYEEDEDFSNPGKSFMDTGAVYTFTNSKVLHPADLTNVTSSYQGVQVATRILSHPPPSAISSPVQQQRARATSTYSMTLGLAKLLNERGIHAIVPTAATTRDHVVSPTPTPTPSPEGSPPPTPPPFGPVRVPDLLARTSIAKGSYLLRSAKKPRRKASPSPPPTTEGETVPDEPSTSSPSSASIGLVDKLSRIGLENIMSTAVSPNQTSPIERSPNDTPVSLSTISDDSPLTLTSAGSEDSTVALKSPGTVVPSSPAAVSPTPLSQSWGFVPPLGFGKGPITGLTRTMAIPLSRTANPMVQLNSLAPLGVNNSLSVGSVGTLKSLRKGGYI